MAQRRSLEIELDASREAWEEFLERFEAAAEGRAGQEARSAGEAWDRDEFWEHCGVRIDPAAFFAVFTGLD